MSNTNRRISERDKRRIAELRMTGEELIARGRNLLLQPRRVLHKSMVDKLREMGMSADKAEALVEETLRYDAVIGQ